MEVTQVIRENDGFDDSSDEEFMHIAKQYYAFKSIKQKYEVI